MGAFFWASKFLLSLQNRLAVLQEHPLICYFFLLTRLKRVSNHHKAFSRLEDLKVFTRASAALL
jgi:hypothetical protein